MNNEETLREALEEGYEFLEKHAKILPSQKVGVWFRMKKALADTKDTGGEKCKTCNDSKVVLVAPGVPGVRANSEDIYGPCPDCKPLKDIGVCYACGRGKEHADSEIENLKSKLNKIHLLAMATLSDTAGCEVEALQSICDVVESVEDRDEH